VDNLGPTPFIDVSLPERPNRPAQIAPAPTAGSTEALWPWAPPPRCLWKRADRISTGWRCTAVWNPPSVRSRNLEAVLYCYAALCCQDIWVRLGPSVLAWRPHAYPVCFRAGSVAKACGYRKACSPTD